MTTETSRIESRVLFLISSNRDESNTEILARHAASFLPANATQVWLRLVDLPLPPFSDLRHSTERYSSPLGNELVLLTETLAATHIVFVAPTYWYSLPAPAKLYLDFWVKWLRLPDYEFKKRMMAKTLAGISVYAGESKEDDWNSQPLIDSLCYSAKYMEMRWGGVLLGHANRPREILQDTAVLAEARYFLKGLLPVYTP